MNYLEMAVFSRIDRLVLPLLPHFALNGGGVDNPCPVHPKVDESCDSTHYERLQGEVMHSGVTSIGPSSSEDYSRCFHNTETFRPWSNQTGPLKQRLCLQTITTVCGLDP